MIVSDAKAHIEQQDTDAHPAVPASLSTSAGRDGTPLPAFPAWLNSVLEAPGMPGQRPTIATEDAIRQTQTLPMPALASPAYVEARATAMHRRRQQVNDYVAAHGVYPCVINLPALDIIALPVEEWRAFRPDHGIVIALDWQPAAKSQEGA